MGGLVLPSSALADEPPPPTTTVPTITQPAPDPAPAPAPPRKPVAQPKPKPAAHRAPAHATYQPTYQPPPAPTPPPVSRPVVRPSKPHVRAHPKPKRVHRAIHPKPKEAALPQLKVSQVLGAVGIRRAFQVAAGNSLDVGSLLILWGLALAISCLAVAVVPPRLVPWRPAAIFVSDRQFGLTLVGAALLATAAVTFFSTRGH